MAGGAALLDSASYNTPALAVNPNSRDARVIKAVLMNSADKIPGWNNGEIPHPNGFGGVRTTQSLDYNSGAGAMNPICLLAPFLLQAPACTSQATAGSSWAGLLED